MATMSKGLAICFSYRKIERIIHKIFGRFEARIRFRRLFAATNSVLYHLGYLPITETALSRYCSYLQADGILSRLDDRLEADWNNSNSWIMGPPGLRLGQLTTISGRATRIYGSITGRVRRFNGYAPEPYDPWKNVSFEMDPLHRFAASL